MMQHAMDPWAFARPLPPGFFGLGSSCARQAVAADVPARRRPPPPGFFDRRSSCARQAVAVAAAVPAGLRTLPPSFIGFGSFWARQADAAVPARPRPPPPGFSRPRRAIPPSPSEIPVPPKLPKRAAPPVSTDAAEKSSTKRRRVCSDYEDDIDANLRLTERNPDERPRPRPDYLKTMQQDLVSPSAHLLAQGEEELKIQRMAHLLADRSLLDYACLGYLPSVVAASAIFLARFALNPPDVLAWITELEELTGYNVLDLGGCLPAMNSFSQSLICEPRC